jgi:hypothetical protein
MFALNISSRQLVEGDDDDYWDEIPDLSQIQTQMLYHRGARMASVADFSAFLPAFLVRRWIVRIPESSYTCVALHFFIHNLF